MHCLMIYEMKSSGFEVLVCLCWSFFCRDGEVGLKVEEMEFSRCK